GVAGSTRGAGQEAIDEGLGRKRVGSFELFGDLGDPPGQRAVPPRAGGGIAGFERRVGPTGKAAVGREGQADPTPAVRLDGLGLAWTDDPHAGDSRGEK